MVEKTYDILPELETDKEYISKCYCVKCGCGNMYISIIYKDDKPYNILIHRKSKAFCDMTFFDALQRQSTFQTRRDIHQLIRDLKGSEGDKHYCQKFNIKIKGLMKEGELAAYSCSDAIARVLRNELKKEEKVLLCKKG